MEPEAPPHRHRSKGVVRGALADVICSLITISYFYLFVKFSSYDYLFSYLCTQLRLSSFGVTIIFLKFATAIFLVTRPYMVSRTHTYNKIVQINIAAE